MVDWKKDIIQWLSNGTDKSDYILDLAWHVTEEKGVIVADHPKIPFILYLSVDDKFVRMSVFTGLQTALLEPVQRLDMARKLLILNDRVDLAKYVIRGINEEIVLKSELDLTSMSKEEFADALTGLTASLFLMVKEFKLEEQFNKQVTERIILMIKDRMEKGENKNDVLNFLLEKVGMDKNSAEKLIDEIIKEAQKVSYLPEYQ